MNASQTIELPSAPATALRLIHLCDDSRVEMKDIVQTISLDAALSAKLLQLANSAHFGQQYQVSTLTRAAVVLGLEYVKVIALSFTLAEATRQCKNLPISVKLIWQGSVLRACLASQLARHSNVPAAQSTEQAFLIGLLQDYAVPIVAQTIGPLYAEMTEQGGLYTRPRTVAAEEQACETNHAMVAGRLFDLWRFPPLITFAITNHHVCPPAEPPSDRAQALWQIAYWVGAIPFSMEQRTAPVDHSLRLFAFSAFKLDANSLGRAFYQAIEQYESVRPIFDAVLPSNVSAEVMLRSAEAVMADKPASLAHS